MGNALLADFQPVVAAPARAALLDAVRISVGNGSVARHFWETALGLHFVSEREVVEEETREAWDIRKGALRLTRLEIAPEVFPKIELLEWEGCSGKPIRNAKHPWDYGLLALRIPVSDLEARLSQLTQWRCKVDRTAGEGCVTTPTGERVIMRQGGEAAVIAVVPSIEMSKGFFRESLLLPNGIPIKAAQRFPGAATVDLAQTLRLGSLEVMEMKRSADPRPAAATESRMHAGYTGYCMLSVTRLSMEGRSSIELIRGPGGTPVEVITTASPVASALSLASAAQFSAGNARPPI